MIGQNYKAKDISAPLRDPVTKTRLKNARSALIVLQKLHTPANQTFIWFLQALN